MMAFGRVLSTATLLVGELQPPGVVSQGQREPDETAPKKPSSSTRGFSICVILYYTGVVLVDLDRVFAVFYKQLNLEFEKLYAFLFVLTLTKAVLTRVTLIASSLSPHLSSMTY